MPTKTKLPTPGACIAFEPKRSFVAYLVDTGRISFISYSAIPIDYIQPEQFHPPLTTDETSPLFISPYNIISKIPRSSSDPLPAFLNCGRHTKLGIVFGVILPNLSLNCTNVCIILPHYLNAIMTDIGAGNLVPRILTADALSEVSQFKFNR